MSTDSKNSHHNRTLYYYDEIGLLKIAMVTDVVY